MEFNSLYKRQREQRLRDKEKKQGGKRNKAQKNGNGE
jgi:hypothetical protein